MTNRGGGDVSGVDHVIAATLTGVGEGISRLRDSGSLIEMVACSIEVHVDEHGPPVARLVLDLRGVPSVDVDG